MNTGIDVSDKELSPKNMNGNLQDDEADKGKEISL